jgi:HlyD family secretion protein
MSQLVFKGTVDEIDVGKLKEACPRASRSGPCPTPWEGTVLQDRAQVQDGGRGHAVRRGGRAQAGGPVVLRAGYSANADIVVREKTDVLLIPERLVTFADGKATVEVPPPAEGEPVKKDIKVGLSDGINIEVAEGCSSRTRSSSVPRRRSSSP